MKVRLLTLLAKLYPMAKRGLYNFKGGVFPSYNKGMSAQHPIHETLIPTQLVLPLQQHVGVEAEAIVKIGERVLKNQLIADAPKGLSAPIHAPTSGTIVAIEPRVLPHPSGLAGVCIVLEPDGKDEAIENSLQVDGTPPKSPETLKDIVYRAGIVGMGGAGFPTFAKIPNEKGKIHTLLMNGAECEPFITCDDLLMQTEADQVVKGAVIVGEALGCERIICGIEDNKPKAIKKMRKAAKNTLVEIQVVPTVYPMGGQKQLTQQLTGVEVPAHAHAVDIGILMMNVATFAAIYQAVTFGNPLVSRLVTVSGTGLQHPFNIQALIGTAFQELAELADPKKPLDYPLVQGGPMMGFEMASNQVPVIKTTNCILANPKEQVEAIMPCIRCGECMDACPVHLLPQQLYWHARSHEFDKVEKLHVFDCIECGCCSFVCPSHIPLVQYYRFAKSEIKKNAQEQALAQQAKQRHEAKLAREERIKREREERIRAKKEAVKQKAAESATPSESEDAPKKSKAGAAAAAARKKKAMTEAEGAETKKPVMSAREKAIAAAKKRAQQSHPTEEAAKETVAPTETTESVEKSTSPKSKKDPKQAAMEAAKRAAARKKAQQAESEDTPASKAEAPEKTPESQEKPSASAEDKRKAAQAAARKRAAAKRRAKLAAEKSASESNSTQSSEESSQ